MQPRNEKFFTLFSKADSNVVESAAINKVEVPQSSPADDAAGQAEESPQPGGICIRSPLEPTCTVMPTRSLADSA